MVRAGQNTSVQEFEIQNAYRFVFEIHVRISSEIEYNLSHSLIKNLYATLFYIDLMLFGY